MRMMSWIRPPRTSSWIRVRTHLNPTCKALLIALSRSHELKTPIHPSRALQLTIKLKDFTFVPVGFGYQIPETRAKFHGIESQRQGTNPRGTTGNSLTNVRRRRCQRRKTVLKAARMRGPPSRRRVVLL